jgi:excisionase family DNA binding protein
MLAVASQSTEMVSLIEAARMLDLDKRTVLGMVRRGQLAGLRIGSRLWRFPRAEVERLAGFAQDARGAVQAATVLPERAIHAVVSATQPHATVSR